MLHFLIEFFSISMLPSILPTLFYISISFNSYSFLSIILGNVKSYWQVWNEKTHLFQLKESRLGPENILHSYKQDVARWIFLVCWMEK